MSDRRLSKLHVVPAYGYTLNHGLRRIAVRRVPKHRTVDREPGPAFLNLQGLVLLLFTCNIITTNITSPYQRLLKLLPLSPIQAFASSSPTILIPVHRPSPHPTNVQRREIAIHRRRCSSTSAVRTSTRHKKQQQKLGSHNLEEQPVRHLGYLPALARNTSRHALLLTRIRWAQGACCFRQDHCSCFKALLWT